MSNAIILLNKTEDNLEARDTILIAENISTKDNNILFPDINLNYDTGDIDDNLNTERTIKEKQDQYIITSTDTINTAVTSEFTDYFLNYKKTDNSVTWVGNRATSSQADKGDIETNTRKVIPVEDFNTNIQRNVPFRTAEDATETNPHTWVSLHACVSDIGLKQATWNINEEYYASHLPEATLVNSQLYVRFAKSSDVDTNLRFTIKYLSKDSDKLLTTTDIIFGDIENDYYPLKDNSGNFKCFKLISVEITAYSTGTTHNTGNLEFFFIPDILNNVDEESGLIKLTMTINQNTFDYNNDFSNCQFTNQYYNKGISMRGTDHSLEFTSTEVINTDMYNHIKDCFEGNHDDYTGYDDADYQDYGSFENIFTGNKLKLELEGGSGRKGEIEIDKSSKNFKIYNPGYLYKQYEILRIKDFRLRNIVNLKVETVANSTKNTPEYVQEVIRYTHGKSNTIKYALGKKESFIIKNLLVCGSVKSDVIVRLIHIKNVLSTKPRQYILKEMVYYSRTNIQENHELNIFIDNESNTIGNEFFIELQKIVKDSNDSGREDGLNFSLNGIKYTDV
jgi:hypothetical protein